MMSYIRTSAITSTRQTNVKQTYNVSDHGESLGETLFHSVALYPTIGNSLLLDKFYEWVDLFEYGVNTQSTIRSY